MTFAVVETRSDSETTVSLLSRINPFKGEIDWRVRIESGGDKIEEGRDTESEARAFFQVMCLAAGISVPVKPPSYEWSMPEEPPGAPFVTPKGGAPIVTVDFGAGEAPTARSVYQEYHQRFTVLGAGTEETKALQEEMMRDSAFITHMDEIEVVAEGKSVWVDALFRTTVRRMRRHQELARQREADQAAWDAAEAAKEQQQIVSAIPGYGAF